MQALEGRVHALGAGITGQRLGSLGRHNVLIKSRVGRRAQSRDGWIINRGRGESSAQMCVCPSGDGDGPRPAGLFSLPLGGASLGLASLLLGPGSPGPCSCLVLASVGHANTGGPALQGPAAKWGF